ncbi:MAG TPA: hypothetical protein VEY95_12820 [Azospirillaceae bacterium]|nr:hypothetical protein [Azospirillaceae bacterium]
MIAHLARIDGEMVASSVANEHVIRGRVLRDILDQVLRTQPLVMPPSKGGGPRVHMHPAAILAAFIATAFAYSAHEEIFAGGDFVRTAAASETADPTAKRTDAGTPQVNVLRAALSTSAETAARPADGQGFAHVAAAAAAVVATITLTLDGSLPGLQVEPAAAPAEAKEEEGASTIAFAPSFEGEPPLSASDGGGLPVATASATANPPADVKAEAIALKSPDPLAAHKDPGGEFNLASFDPTGLLGEVPLKTAPLAPSVDADTVAALVDHPKEGVATGAVTAGAVPNPLPPAEAVVLAAKAPNVGESGGQGDPATVGGGVSKAPAHEIVTFTWGDFYRDGAVLIGMLPPSEPGRGSDAPRTGDVPGTGLTSPDDGPKILPVSPEPVDGPPSDHQVPRSSAEKAALAIIDFTWDAAREIAVDGAELSSIHSALSFDETMPANVDRILLFEGAGLDRKVFMLMPGVAMVSADQVSPSLAAKAVAAPLELGFDVGSTIKLIGVIDI